ncbi:3-octaprenyl-4-hydroxybenzoate carboxy-lyase, partial [Dissostichus eleginoides]
PAQFCGPGGMNPVLTELISISPSPPSVRLHPGARRDQPDTQPPQPALHQA